MLTRLTREVASGLRYLHSMEYLHRDVKAQNILLTAPPSGDSDHVHAALADFGLAKQLGDAAARVAIHAPRSGGSGSRTTTEGEGRHTKGGGTPR